MGKAKKARAGAKKRARAAAQAAREAQEQFRGAAQRKAEELAAVATREQYVAMLDSPHARNDPATGRPVDKSRMPDNIGGPYYSEPYKHGRFKRQRYVRKWFLRPVGWRGPDDVVIPALTLVWASFEEAV
jgi:hypothetical protein